MKKIIISFLFLFSVLHSHVWASNVSDEEVIGLVIDDFHDAADKGDKQRYLSHFSADGVFMGTDSWERWPVNPEFTQYVNDHFKDGKGWSYKSIERHISFNRDQSIAWFDEIIVSPKWGKFRGTGILEKQDKGWKIAHYSMSFLVPNEVWEETAKLAKDALRKKRSNVE